MRPKKYLAILFFLIIFLCCGSSSQDESHSFGLRIIHLNDPHSHLDPVTDVTLNFDGVPTTTSIGGMARIKCSIDELKKTERNFITLHAGDAVQGTYYFTFFDGAADIGIHNLLGIDAMTFGNHEFDRGPEFVNAFVELADFSIISANIDFSKEPQFKQDIKPYIIKRFGHEKVGVIGITTADTAYTSSPGPHIVFNDVTISVKNAVGILQGQSVNKIIVLSHIGYNQDKQLAKEVSGIDVIVGGHSHTLLGDREKFASFGITIPEGYDYPTVVKNPEGKDVLIVQAWCYGETVGMLDVDFDEKGEIVSFSGHPILINTDVYTQGGFVVTPDVYKNILRLIAGTDILHIFSEDTQIEATIKPYRDKSAEDMKEVITEAESDIVRSLNGGPGPLTADSMVWKTNSGLDVKLSIENRGAMRADIAKGNINYGKVIEVLPFGSTVVVLGLAGSEVKNALEDGVDFVINKYHDDNHYPYVSGMKYTMVKSAVKGSRITGIKIKNPDGSYSDFDINNSYRVALNSYLAAGGDGFTTLKNASGYRYDTGFIDYEVLSGYLKTFEKVTNPTEERVTIIE